ncbi:MAG TPA: hypothetical protein VJV79_29175 [Polyangiaceae bacterium]|nr:hypothetical protein [Polyangiaceae bacterium]
MVDPAFEALWKSVLDRWQDERVHGAFLEYCRTSEKLAEAAARYRGMKGDRDRSAVAEKRLAGIAIVALAQLHATRTQVARAPRRISSLILAGVLGLATAGLLAYLLSTRY